MPPYRASVAMMATGLRRVCTSTTSAASWSLVRGRSERVSVCSGAALAAPARSRAANGATKSLLSMRDPRDAPVAFQQGGDPMRPQASDRPAGTAPARPSAAPACALLPFHHQRAGERVRLDHALSLSEARLQPAAGHSVLAPGGPLDHQIQLVAQLPAVRGVAQLERALRVQGQPDVARHRLRAQMAILSANPGPVQTA